MKDQELIDRGKILKQLMDFPPWKYLVEEMMEKCDTLKDVIVEDSVDMRLKERGIRSGILEMINTPFFAVETMEEILTEQEDAQPTVE